jgi:hypothetical protein
MSWAYKQRLILSVHLVIRNYFTLLPSILLSSYLSYRKGIITTYLGTYLPTWVPTYPYTYIHTYIHTYRLSSSTHNIQRVIRVAPAVLITNKGRQARKKKKKENEPSKRTSDDGGWLVVCLCMGMGTGIGMRWWWRCCSLLVSSFFRFLVRPGSDYE